MYITKDEFEVMRNADLIKSKKSTLLTDFILTPLKNAHDQIISDIYVPSFLSVKFDVNASTYKFLYDIHPTYDRKPGVTLISSDIPPGVFTSEEERALFIRIVSNKFFDIRDTVLAHNVGFCKLYSLKDKHSPGVFAQFGSFVKGLFK